jgi:CDP-glucose 4,6-dehydratase
MDDLVKFLRNAFNGRSVLITGDTGFKGSWLALCLLELGAHVHGYALAPEHSEGHFRLLHLDDSINHCDGDIRDISTMQNFFNKTQPEILFHLAAQPLVGQSYVDPKTTFDTNIGGSVNVLECIRNTPSLRAAVYITSDKCYVNNEWVWGYRESDKLGGHDPYSASKAAAELVLSAYVDSFFCKNSTFGVASVRAGNVIGGGDWAGGRIVPDCIRALRNKEPIIIRSPQSTRPWQHVLEPLSGYLKLAAMLLSDPSKFGGAWNFGPNGKAVRTVYDVASSLVDNWGNGEIVVDANPNVFHEARLLHLNCDRANFELGWVPRWDFNRTMAETATWYREVTNGANPREVSCRQINQYFGF